MEKAEPGLDRKKEIIKKIILMALLIAVLLFLFIQRDYLRNEKKVHMNTKDDDGPLYDVSILGNHVIEQPVIMRTDSFRTIRILFNNPGRNTASGNVKLEFFDESGDLIASTDIDASLIKENRYTKLLLGVNSDSFNSNRIVSTNTKERDKGIISVVKGDTYTFRLTTENVRSEEDLSLVLSDYTDSGNNDILRETVIDGEPQQNSCLYMSLGHRKYSWKTISFFLFLIIMTLIFVLLPFGRIDEYFAGRRGIEGAPFSTAVTRAMFILSPFVAYFIIQKYMGFGLFAFLRQLTDRIAGKGVLNIMIIGLLWWFIYTVSNRVRLASMLTVLLSSAFGFMNYILVLFRDAPLVATDIAQTGTALQVAGSYSVTYNKPFLWAVTLTALWCIAAYAPPGHKGLDLKKRIIPAAVLVIWAGIFYYTIFAGPYIEDHQLRVSSFKPKGSYTQNGCALSFMISWRNSIVKKPDAYDAAEIKALSEKYESDDAAPADKVSKGNPNVIIVMNESFSDMAVLGDFRTNEDVLPFFNSLEENTVKGWMHSSVFGGSTANSEFECLTGFSMRFLPFQSVPYRSIIKNPTPSLSEYMKTMGYGGNIAFHPGMKNSYNRDKVYPLLGFDTHIAYEDLGEKPYKIRDYVSDEYDYEYVESEYEKFRSENADRPFYMFNVTIQNHGGYEFKTGVVDAGIKILSPECRQDSAVQFMNLMRLSDEALEKLIDYYRNVDEETVIILFGDHQPRISGEFYDAMRAQQKDLSELEWTDRKHQVPFMIWANYDINEQEKAASDAENGQELHLSANYISPYLKRLIGMPMTGFDKYLLDMYQELPVIDAICYQDSEGNVYDPEEESALDEKIKEYQRVQYNGLIDFSGRVEEFFTLKQK